MKKVKVKRYVSGKRPEYAASSDEDSGDGYFFDDCPKILHADEAKDNYEPPSIYTDTVVHEDPRLKRLTRLEQRDDTDKETVRHRRIHEPVLLEENDEQPEHRREKIIFDNSASSEDEDLSDTEIRRRRDALKARVLSNKNPVQDMAINDEEEKISTDSDNSSEYEEYSDSEEEMGPRLKPVFVRSNDRVTVREREERVAQQKEAEMEKKKMAEERRKETLLVIVLLN